MQGQLLQARQMKERWLTRLVEAEAAFQSGASGLELIQLLCHQMDDLVLHAFRCSLRENYGQSHSRIQSLALIALGGFGRRQLCPYSDVDLMFLYRERTGAPCKEIIKSTFQMLWDMGLEIGHAARTPAQAMEQGRKDQSSLTSMLEGRFLAGDRAMYELFRKGLNEHFLHKGRKGFLEDKIKERQRRLERFGQTVFNQEPHLKEGIGALRDLHHGLWIGQILMGARDIDALQSSRVVSPSEAALLKEAFDYIIRMRFGLHFQCGKREDHVSFARQETLAKSMGFVDQEEQLAEAGMLRRYFRLALYLKRFAGSMTRLARSQVENKPFFAFTRRGPKRPVETIPGPFTIRHEEIDFKEYQPHPEQMRKYFAEDPNRFIPLIQALQKSPILWARPVCLALEASRDLVDEHFIERPEVGHHLLQIFQKSWGCARVLFSLRDAELLWCFFPELSNIRFLVRHDFYHRYSVDEHSIRAVAEIDRLCGLKARTEITEKFSEESLAFLVQRQQHPELLRLSALFHDAGKGKGSSHSEVGAELIVEPFRRLGVDGNGLRTVQFLIRNHLLMSEAAFRRDIDDFKAVKEFTDQVGSIDRLEQLLILTYVDVTAVAPAMMTPWKAGLLWQLYMRSRRLMLGEPGVLAADQEQSRMVILNILQAHFARQEVEELLDQMPPQYTRFSTPGLVGRHLSALNNYDGTRLVASIRFLALHEIEHSEGDRDSREDTIEVVLCTRDRLGLFRDIARSFHLENFHIISARLFTRTDGTVIDTIVAVNALPDSPVSRERQQVLIERLEKAIGPNRPPQRFTISPLPELRELSSADLGRSSFQTRIQFVPHASADYSLIEVRAMDHPALLETVAACLTAAGLDIRFARLQKQGIRIVQAFDVSGQDGEKIEDSARKTEIRNMILKYLDSTGTVVKT